MKERLLLVIKTALRLIWPIAAYLLIQWVVSFAMLYGLIAFQALQAAQFGSGLSAAECVQAALTLFNENVIFGSLIAALAGIPIFLWAMYRDHRKRVVAGEHSITEKKNLWLAAVIGGVSSILLNNLIAISGLSLLFPSYSEGVSTMLFAPPLWLQILSIGIVIPLVEELIFRGLGFRRLRNVMGFYPAAILTSLLFAIVHGNMVQGVYAFCLGMLLAWVYERFGSFWAPFLFHMVANLASVLFQAAGFDQMYASALFFWGITIVCLILTIWSGGLIHKRTQEKEDEFPPIERL